MKDSEGKERLLTSGYGACRYSAGRGVVRCGGSGRGGGLFVSEDVFPQMQCLRAAVCERARCVCLGERLRVISTGKSLFSQSSEE